MHIEKDADDNVSCVIFRDKFKVSWIFCIPKYHDWVYVNGNSGDPPEPLECKSEKRVKEECCKSEKRVKEECCKSEKREKEIIFLD